MNDYSFVVLIDAIREGTVLRCKNDTHTWEAYNYGTTQWEKSLLILEYFNDESMFADLYRDISEEEAKRIIADYSEHWRKVWTVARAVCKKYYGSMPSPIKDMMYDEYVVWLSEYATNQYDRVLYAFSGMPGLTDWDKQLKSLGIRKSLIDDLAVYHTDSSILGRESYHDVLNARIRELSLLLTRKDLVDPNKISKHYTLLSNGFSKEEIFGK